MNIREWWDRNGDDYSKQYGFNRQQLEEEASAAGVGVLDVLVAKRCGLPIPHPNAEFYWESFVELHRPGPAVGPATTDSSPHTPRSPRRDNRSVVKTRAAVLAHIEAVAGCKYSPGAHRGLSPSGKRWDLHIATIATGHKGDFFFGFQTALLNAAEPLFLVLAVSESQPAAEGWVKFVIPCARHTEVLNRLSSSRGGRAKRLNIRKEGETYFLLGKYGDVINIDCYRDRFDLLL
jgi:hypothetical protein